MDAFMANFVVCQGFYYISNSLCLSLSLSLSYFFLHLYFFLSLSYFFISLFISLCFSSLSLSLSLSLFPLSLFCYSLSFYSLFLFLFLSILTFRANIKEQQTENTFHRSVGKGKKFISLDSCLENEGNLCNQGFYLEALSEVSVESCFHPQYCFAFYFSFPGCTYCIQ